MASSRDPLDMSLSADYLKGSPESRMPQRAHDLRMSLETLEKEANVTQKTGNTAET